MSGDGDVVTTRALPPPGWPPVPRYGDRSVAIANDRNRVVQRSVESLAALPSDLPRAALVGGLAVMVRLYEAHRVTTDFDEVTEGREATVGLLMGQGAIRTPNGVLFPDHGVQLDLIDAAITLRDLDAYRPFDALDEVEQRAVQLALVSRYALETAVNTKIFVVEHEQIVAQVTLPVALAGALVAMKVHAARQPDRLPDKAAGDIYDAYRLIRAWGPGVVAEDLSRAPVPMLERVAGDLDAIFVDGAERSARKLRAASMPGVDAVSVDDLTDAGETIAALQPFLVWDDRDLGTTSA